MTSRLPVLLEPITEISARIAAGSRLAGSSGCGSIAAATSSRSVGDDIGRIA
jgi:hypothetical protein